MDNEIRVRWVGGFFAPTLSLAKISKFGLIQLLPREITGKVQTMEQVTYSPIGVIRSPFKETAGTPIQPTGAGGIRGTIEIDPQFVPGLKDLEGFSHLILIYHFHFSRGYSLLVKPFLDESLRGVFATRAPRRPNPIGISVVRLIGIEQNILHIEDVDIVDGTPLLDLKPYVPQFDYRQAERIGWLHEVVDKAKDVRADARFE